MPTVSPVDPLQFELRGSHLIEASAGTGKTWTIAALYVRLVLGHGGHPPRLPADILVLTFTEAAARELRDRIRARLSQAAAAFAEPDDASTTADAAPDAAGDAFLAGLRAHYPPDEWPNAARLLALAAQSMDEASIFTIHAWCARVLRQHAFDSGSLFDQDLQTDLREQIRQVAWDYWRSQVAGLDGALLDHVLSVWPKPDALLDLSTLLTLEALPSAPDMTLARACAQAAASRAVSLQALKRPWVRDADVLEHWLEDIRGGLKRYSASTVHRWLDALRSWAGDPAQESPPDMKKGWERLVPEGIAAWWSGMGPAPSHPLSAALAQLQRDLADLSLRGPLLQHAVGWMAARLQQALSARAQTGFDGLLAGLARALEGERGPILVRTLRRQFPVALIDEFQDTDPLQYRIFDRVYDVARNDPETALVLIGDPKQSIYGFRGADVHTYLRAARDCGDRVHTLDRNFRASHAMVDAVNRCFGRRGDSAFPTGIPGETIAFEPVKSRGRRDTWRVEGSAGSALNGFWLAPERAGETLGVGRYRDQAAALCAARIASLLAMGRSGGAGFDDEEQGFRAVRPADVAVLVNNHAEARQVRAALGRVGLRSVYLSERDSVYDSPLARELAVCLRACAQPEDERAVRAALATPLLGLSVNRLDALVEDESAWDAQVGRFQAYHRCWWQRGLLPMLRMLMHDFEVPARLLADGAEGERQLTDCLHLAELLQQAADHLDGQHAVLRFLEQQRQSPTDEDARRVRLESDEDLVRVVTVHKSKGLEYPLVFLPFVCAAPSARHDRGPARLIQDGRSVWVMAPDDAQARQLALERLGEEVRKLYVALTRACHAAWVVLGPLKAVNDSGIGHVLGEDLHAAWDGLVGDGSGAVVWERDDAWEESLRVEEDAPRALGPARRLAGPAVAQSWWIASYSALHRPDAARDAATALVVPAAPQSAAEDVLRENRWAPAALAEGRGAQPDGGRAGPLRDFPRGSEAGTFLHGLLEWAGRRQFRHLEDARDLIARRCKVRGWEAHIDGLHQWLVDFAATDWRLPPPDGSVLRLDSVQTCVPEMEFWLPVADLDTARLDGRIGRQLFPGVDRPGLAPTHLNGMFKGFIDLVLQADGRYYLIDYKSNDLGPQASDYAPPALVRAMCTARYDVQMAMYVLALHRQLKARLPDYRYDRHMGGALYLFLRGQDFPGQGLLAGRPPESLVEALDALFRGQSGGESHEENRRG
ncbi:MAG TPA: exodeoxyribonuclease V subunit beta [Castellaniella sp.]|jgi:exodeoxyribonuclease V beta subunit|nr:exodeoxyribonuclease V subunit beta [Castellaniella sp.]